MMSQGRCMLRFFLILLYYILYCIFIMPMPLQHVCCPFHIGPDQGSYHNRIK